MTDKDKLKESVKMLNACAYYMGMHSAGLYHICNKTHLSANKLIEEIKNLSSKMDENIIKLFYGEYVNDSRTNNSTARTTNSKARSRNKQLKISTAKGTG